VTPADVGRVAIGLGSGYLSGALVGNVMGKVLGLKPQYLVNRLTLLKQNEEKLFVFGRLMGGFTS